MFSSNTSQVSNAANYIEDVFSTWLYTGNGGTNTIANGVDLSTYGGMVWVKNRAAVQHAIGDTVALGFGTYLSSNTTAAASTDLNSFQTFNSNGFTVKQSTLTGASSNNYTSWTFRKQPKFFDVVTYTGDGTANRNVAHSLAAAPGFVIIKRTSGSSNWCVAARLNSGDASFMMLNRTVAQTSTSASWFNSTTFKVGTSDWPSSTGSPDFFGYDTNSTGETYVAYLFAHNAGGFGLTGTDNVISCGSFTTDGSGNATVNLGYEPQWVMYKRSDGTGSWAMFDNMRGMTVNTTNGDAILFANLADAESTVDWIQPTATGFNPYNIAWNATYIYIAIRRGPMKTPTSGTSVFAPVYVSAVAGTAQTTNFPVDAQILRYPQDTYSNFFVDRLRGVSTTPANQASPYLLTNTADAETTGPNLTYGWGNTGFAISSSFNNLLSIFWNFRRAPGFFDQVCYTGNGSSQTINHNLTVVPELVIFKVRTTTSNWWTTFNFSSNYQRMALDLLNTPSTISYAPASEMTAAPTSSALSLGNTARVNGSGNTYTAYLFASCPGVSKVGVVQITTAPQTVDCGFTSGARFVLIKSITSSSNSAYGWRVYDTARGITSGNDPVLYLNSTEGQTNTQNSINAVASGFQITGNDPYLSSGSFIYLAIA